ncbi:zinc finger protein 628-like isoform X2 [Vespula squamosa]|uniref:Zinc finger protein 628-like isoform X2 n=1 Tax=Vespula squamosa TaxID=30214 RepID=A0ABD2AVA7_VESSQ
MPVASAGVGEQSAIQRNSTRQPRCTPSPPPSQAAIQPPAQPLSGTTASGSTAPYRTIPVPGSSSSSS